jgi:hypothetical protein
MPSQANASLLVEQQPIFPKLIVNIESFESEITVDASLDDMPNLSLMKPHSHSPTILNAILQAEGEELPVRNHTLGSQAGGVAVANLGEEIAVESQQIDVLEIFHLREEFELLLILEQSKSLDYIACGQFGGGVQSASTVDGVLVFSVELELLASTLFVAHELLAII